jgi:integrase
LDRKIDYAANNAPELLPDLKATRKAVMDEPPGEIVLDDDATISANLKAARLMGIVVPPDTDPTILQHLFGDKRLWTERLSNSRKTEKNKTVGFQLNNFLEEIQSSQKPATYREVALYLRETLTTDVWSAETAAEKVDEQTVSRFYKWLIAKNFSSGQHNKVLGFFRRFVSWLDTQNLLNRLPKNLKIKAHRKKKTYKAVRVFHGVKETIEALPERFRLWAYLNLNCGMTEADLGETEWEQIDTTKWTLTRRRAKTGDNPDVPTVRYKLFPETITELKKLKHRKGLLFQTTNGKPMYVKWYEKNDKGETEVHIKDLFSTYWNRQEPKLPVPLGKFRSIGTTALRTDPIMRQYDERFLGHVGGLTDQHYGVDADKAFFQALEHIRQTVLIHPPKPEC